MLLTFEKGLDGIYRVLRFITDKILGYGAAAVMLGSTLLALAEVFRRYVLDMVWQWGQDAVTFFIIGSIFLFFSVTQARRSHLAVTALLDWFKSKGYIRTMNLLRMFNSILALSFYSAFSYWGIPAVERIYAMGRTTQSMTFLLWPFQLSLLVGFMLMALLAMFQLYQDVNAVLGRSVFPWAETEEGLEI